MRYALIGRAAPRLIGGGEGGPPPNKGTVLVRPAARRTALQGGVAATTANSADEDDCPGGQSWVCRGAGTLAYSDVLKENSTKQILREEETPTGCN